MSSKKTLVCIIEYLYIGLIILESNTVYSCSEKFASLPYIIVCVTFLLFVSKIAYYHLKRNRLNKYFVAILLYILITGIYAAVNVSSTVLAGYISKFMIFVPLSIGIFYLPDNRESNQLFLKRFVKFICFLALASLVFWLFGSVLNIISPNMVFTSYWARYIDFKGYFGLLFENQFDEALGIYRNDGIFAEGPMYSVWLVMALCFEMFNLEPDENNKKERKKHLFKEAILILTILSTFTTAGVLAIVALYAYKLLNTNTNSTINKLLKVVLVLIMVAAISLPLLSLVTNKLDSYSGVTRLGSLTSSLYAWIKHPLFGNGYNSMKSITSISNALYGRDTGNSNSIFLILAQGGVVLASVYLIPLIFTLYKGIKEHNKVFMINFYIVVFEMIVTWIPYKFSLLMIISLLYVNFIEKSKVKI